MEISVFFYVHVVTRRKERHSLDNNELACWFENVNKDTLACVRAILDVCFK